MKNCRINLVTYNRISNRQLPYMPPKPVYISGTSTNNDDNTALQSQRVVTAYMENKQLHYFGFVWQNSLGMTNVQLICHKLYASTWAKYN